MPLREWTDGFWTIDGSLRRGGMQLGTRTTVIRLRQGGLLLHSPGPLDDAVRAAIEKEGPVRALVAPNALHHLFLPENAAAFPGAGIWAAPGVREKRKDLDGLVELGDTPPELWAGDLEQVAIEGVPRMRETAFFHPASRTLLLTDLVFNFQHCEQWTMRLLMRINHAYGRFGPSRVMRSMIRDKPALRGSLERILAWAFDRVVVTHGDVLENAGRATLRAAFDGIC